MSYGADPFAGARTQAKAAREAAAGEHLASAESPAPPSALPRPPPAPTPYLPQRLPRHARLIAEAERAERAEAAKLARAAYLERKAAKKAAWERGAPARREAAKKGPPDTHNQPRAGESRVASASCESTPAAAAIAVGRRGPASPALAYLFKAPVVHPTTAALQRAKDAVASFDDAPVRYSPGADCAGRETWREFWEVGSCTVTP